MIGEELNLNHTTVHQILTNELKMRNISAPKWFQKTFLSEPFLGQILQQWVGEIVYLIHILRCRQPGIVVSDAICCAVGPGFESQRRHGCLSMYSAFAACGTLNSHPAASPLVRCDQRCTPVRKSHHNGLRERSFRFLSRLLMVIAVKDVSRTVNANQTIILSSCSVVTLGRLLSS
ncbi:hypothetical protein TNCV_3973621 [Trichonephila clavipes]|nr:hypothetical protein TNCV_3973621 [Trichonephila clavipes]